LSKHVDAVGGQGQASKDAWVRGLLPQTDWKKEPHREVDLVFGEDGCKEKCKNAWKRARSWLQLSLCSFLIFFVLI
jgi:ribosomal protein S9